MTCLFAKEQHTCDCLSAAYNKRGLSGCTKRSLTQTIESLALELKISYYCKDGRRFFKQSSLAATFCVSDHVSAARNPSKLLYVIRQTAARGVLSLKRQGRSYFSETLFLNSGFSKTNNEIYFSQESERKNPQVKMIQQNISKNDSSCPHKKCQRHFKESESLLQ